MRLSNLHKASHEEAQHHNEFLCGVCAFLCLKFLPARRGPLSRSFVFRNCVRFGEQSSPKRSKHFEQQIEFSQTLTPGTDRAEKKLELNASTTISDCQHAVAPFVFTTATRFNFREYVRGMTG